MLAGTQKPMLGMKLNRAHPLTKGLVGCWLFNEGVGNVAYDSSGYGNHGTLTNMAAPPTAASGWNPGRTGVAIAFDGSNDYINCPHSSSIDLINSFTIELGVKLNNNCGLIAKRTESYEEGYAIDVVSGKVKTTIEQQDNTCACITGTTTITDNQWYHVAVVRDYENYLYLYINGKSDATPVADTLTATIHTWHALYIGRANHPTLNFLNGLLDFLKIYNRALSAEEVKWLYREQYAMFERGGLLL